MEGLKKEVDNAMTLIDGSPNRLKELHPGESKDSMFAEMLNFCKRCVDVLATEIKSTLHNVRFRAELWGYLPLGGGED